MTKVSLTQRQFAQGSVYAFARVLNQAMGFFLLPIMARYLGRDGYGMLSLATTIASIAATVMMQGQLSAWFRLRYKYPQGEQKQFESTVIWYVIASLALGIGLLSLAGPSLSAQWLPGVPFFPIIFLALVAEAASELIGLFQRKQQAEQRPFAFLLLSGIKTALGMGLAIALIVGAGRGVRGRLEADVIAGVGIALVLLAIHRPEPPWQADISKLKASVRWGVPLIVHQLANSINAIADRTMINYFLGLAPAGLYAMGYKFVSVGMILATALNQAFSSLLYETLSASVDLNESERATRFAAIRQSSLYQIVAVACLLLTVSALSREALVVMASREFEEAWEQVPILAGGILLLAAYQPLSGTLMYFGRIGLLPAVAVGAAIVNIALNFILLPRIGVMGAAWATLISNGLLFGLTALIARRLFQTYDWNHMASVMLIATVGFSSLWLLDWAIHPVIPRVAAKVTVLIIVLVVLLKGAGLRMDAVKAFLLLARKKVAR